MAWLGLFFSCLLLLIMSISLIFSDVIPIHRDLGTEYMLKIIIFLVVSLPVHILFLKFCRRLSSITSNEDDIYVNGEVIKNNRIKISELSLLGHTFGKIKMRDKIVYFVPKKGFIKYRPYVVTSEPRNISIQQLLKKVNATLNNKDIHPYPFD